MKRKAIWIATLFVMVALFARARANETSPWGAKSVGVLVVAEYGGGEWNRFVSDARKALGKGVPLEAYAGALGSKPLQKAVDRLQAERIERIIVVPVVLDSAVPEVEQLRYLFGAREFPSEAFLEKWRMGKRLVARVKTKLPVVITAGIDGHDSVANILLSHAKTMSRDPAKETVLLLGVGGDGDDEHARLSARIDSLARGLAAQGRFAGASGFLVRSATAKRPLRREQSIRALRRMIREASQRSRVLIVPCVLIDDGSLRGWKKELDNLFYRWKGTTLLPDPALIAWLKERVEQARTADTMVVFKDGGHLLPSKKLKSKLNP